MILILKNNNIILYKMKQNKELNLNNNLQILKLIISLEYLFIIIKRIILKLLT